MDNGCLSWARKLVNAAALCAVGTAYVNFMPNDEAQSVEAAYGPNYRRLAEFKLGCDPSNLFRMNPNVTPAGN